MRTLSRLTALLLCLALLCGTVFAADPVLPEVPADEPPAVTEAPLPQEPDTTEAPVFETEAPEAPVTETEAPALPVTETEAPTEPVPETEAPEELVPETEAPEEAPDREKTPPKAAAVELSDEEIVAKYNIKQTWSRKALIYAVRNGILKGKGNNDLAPKDYTTYAELATILVRILKTSTQADLSRFTDLQRGKWYYKDMARAVELGLFPISNANATTLTPNEYITREEVFAALARMFGVHTRSRQSMYRFGDWEKVRDWSWREIAAMIEEGYVRGSDGNICPRDLITREELAQVIYNLITKVDTTVGGTYFKGRLALGASSLEPGTVIKGDLLFSNEAGAVTLENVTVTGKLIVQGNGPLELHLNGCSINEIILCRDTELWTENKITALRANKAVTLHGVADSAEVYHSLSVPAESYVERVTTINDGAAVEINGEVANLSILTNKAGLSGEGLVHNLLVRGHGFRNNSAITPETQEERLFATFVGSKATRTDADKLEGSSSVMELGLKLTNVPADMGLCDFRWYLNGQVFAGSSLEVQEGSVIKAKVNLANYANGSKLTVPLVVWASSDAGYYKIYSGSINLEDAVRYAAQNVRTQDVLGRVRNTATLYRYSDFTGSLTTVYGGTQVTILMSKNTKSTKVRLSDGTVGWLNYYNVDVISGSYYTTTDYSTAVKEYYVNKVRNCSSGTQYLIWVSLYTQRINIFQGSKGNWKLIRSGPIASGRNDCPTPVEVVSIIAKPKQWVYEHYYCHHVSVFDEARGFHSRPTAYDGSIYSYDMGYPASNGCVRLMDEDCIFIYNNCPMGTAVYIY